MLSFRRQSFDLKVKLKIVTEAEAVTTVVELPVNTAFHGEEMAQPATRPVFW